MHAVCIAIHVAKVRFSLRPEGARHPFCVEASAVTVCVVGAVCVGLPDPLSAEVVVVLFAAVGVAEGFGGFLDLVGFSSAQGQLGWSFCRVGR